MGRYRQIRIMMGRDRQKGRIMGRDRQMGRMMGRDGQIGKRQVYRDWRSTIRPFSDRWLTISVFYYGPLRRR